MKPTGEPYDSSDLHPPDETLEEAKARWKAIEEDKAAWEKLSEEEQLAIWNRQGRRDPNAPEP